MSLAGAVRRVRATPAGGFARYRPGPPHLRFHEDPSQTRLLRGPNQSGKTQAGAAEMVDRCLGRGTRQSVHPPPIRARIVCHDFKQSLAVQRKLWEMLPKRELDPRTYFDKVTGFRHKWVGFRNGSEIRIVTVGMDTLAHASETLHVVWIDEPPDPGVYAESQVRTVATDGIVYLTLTPVDRPCGWLKDIVDGKIPPELEDLWDDTLAHTISEHHYGLSVENCPWMTEAKVRRAISKIPVYDRPQRAHGEWEGLTVDRTLSAFNPGCLFDPADLGPFAGWDGIGAVEIPLSADHGERAKFSCWLLAAYQKRAQGRVQIRVLGEYVNPKATDDLEDAEGIRDMVEAVGLTLDHIDWGVGDINTGGKSQGGRKLNDIMVENLARLMGLPVRSPSFLIRSAWKRPGSEAYGIRLTNNQLKRGDLLISLDCPLLIEACRHWTGEKTGDLPHRIDALRYLVVEIFREIEGLAGAVRMSP